MAKTMKDYMYQLPSKELVQTISKCISEMGKSGFVKFLDLTKEELKPNGYYYTIFGQLLPARYHGTNDGFKYLREVLGHPDTIPYIIDYETREIIEVDEDYEEDTDFWRMWK